MSRGFQSNLFGKQLKFTWVCMHEKPLLGGLLSFTVVGWHLRVIDKSIEECEEKTNEPKPETKEWLYNMVKRKKARAHKRGRGK